MMLNFAPALLSTLAHKAQATYSTIGRGLLCISFAAIAACAGDVTPDEEPEPIDNPPVFEPIAYAESQYAENCSICHGINGEGGAGFPPLDRVWTVSELQPAVTRMLDLHGECQSSEPDDCIVAMTNYIIEQFTPTMEPPIEVGDFLINTPVKALTAAEFYNTLEAVFSISFTDEQKAQFNLPLDSSASRYSTDSTLRVLRGISTAPDVLDDLYPALTSVTQSLQASINESHFQNLYSAETACDFSEITNSADCRAAYNQAILSKAFRRTVATDDSALNTLLSANEIFIAEGQSVPEAFTNAVISYVVFSPEFIFHSYRGEEASDEGHLLTNLELAHKIAYLIWGTPADATLISQDWRQLLSGEDDLLLDAEVQRLFADTQSKYFINNYLQQWLGLDTDLAQAISTTNDADRAEEFADAVVGESEHFIRHLINQNESIETIINANFSFMNVSLADYYQVDIPGLGNEYVRVDFENIPGLHNRQGLLTQANFLTTGSKSDRPGTVHRGVTILKDILCYSLGPPSGETPDIGDIDRTLHTEPALFRMVTETPGSSCLGCHQNINPISFPFEAFDRFGRHPLALSDGGSLPEYAVYEAVGVANNPNANGPVEKADTFYLDARGGSIDFSTDYGRQITGSFNDHTELLNVINQSPAFSECLNDNLYDFIIGTNAERGQSASNDENEFKHASQTASKAAALADASGARALIVNLLKRPEFRIIQRD